MQTDTESPAWGDTADGAAHWSAKKTLTAVGIAVLLGVGGAAVIAAVDDGAAPESSNFGGPHGPGGPGQDANVPTALHGQYVVSDDEGAFTTQLTQTGTITEISDSAITARSADGFVATYTITADTRQSREPVHSGDTATIRGVLRDGTSTATAISPQR